MERLVVPVWLGDHILQQFSTFSNNFARICLGRIGSSGRSFARGSLLKILPFSPLMRAISRPRLPPRANPLGAAVYNTVVLGHSRWKNENNGWMDLTKHWAFKHGFLHACRHRPNQTNASGQREPVSNHGLAAVTLILLIAFALTSAFVLRHSKLARRDHMTAIAVAAELRAWVSKTPPSIRAPD